MVEGKGHAGRLEERHREKRLSRFIKDRNSVIVIPDMEDAENAGKKK